MKIQINENALLRNLGAVFTDHQKVLSELLQNGRRAGADRVTFTAVDREDDYDLVVHDNGTGLSDFGVLFTLAGSDWNDDIMASEYPYGLGFMAALFAAEQVTIESGTAFISVNVDEAISGRDFGVPSKIEAGFIEGVRITLHQCKAPRETLSAKLKQLAVYSSIDVAFSDNGEPAIVFPSPYRLSEIIQQYPAEQVVEAPFGTVIFRMALWDDEIAIIAQDNLVYSTLLPANVIVFANDQFPCRMPDRDKIINQADALSQVRSTIASFYSTKLAQVRTTYEDDTKFVEDYWHKLLKWCPEMLCDIPYMPASAVGCVVEPSQCFEQGWLAKKGVHQDDDQIVVYHQFPTFADHYCFYASEAVFLHPTIRAKIPEEHWIFKREIRAEDAHTEIHYETMATLEPDLDRCNVDFNVVVVSDMTLTHPLLPEPVSVAPATGFFLDEEKYGSKTDGPFPYPGLGDTLFIRVKAGEFISTSSVRDLLLQVSTYEDAYEQPNDDALDVDSNRLRSELDLITTGNPNVALREALQNLPSSLLRHLAGQSVTIDFSDTGVPSL